MKIAPVVHELKKRDIPQFLVHTGQHYDSNMSQTFFEQLGMPEPDVYLGVGSDTHARQTAHVVAAFEEVCQQRTPDLVVVGGDVNSTLAAALVAAKQHIQVGHVEAGLRSFDRTMPEEINRICADHLSEMLFTTEKSGDENLRKEGISKEKIHFVGNCMVDTLLKHVGMAVQASPWEQFDLKPGHYGLLTLHRPSNVDDPRTLRSIVKVIGKASGDAPILFPVHPRTRERLQTLQLKTAPSLRLCDPLPYLSFVGLMAKAKFVLTDSGGIQEETTVLNIPCLTLRWNTERPITLTKGTNRLVGTDAEKIEKGVQEIFAGKWRRGRRPPLWDGKAAIRIADVIQKKFK
jgi:UDP-N-acetylglucosamine 2-epimerase (non-hydrolysing)